MSQVYMTAKLNLADGTILYPQVSLDNIVASISDPTLVSVATTTDGKVPIAQLPTTLTVTESNTAVPTNGAVYGALGTKQDTLVEGDNIIHIINGSTIMADITNLDVAGIDQTATNGVHLVLDGGNTVSAAAELVTGESAGVLGGVGDGIALSNGVVSADVGSGLKIGASTTSDAGKVAIDEASVETTLQDVRIDDGSTVSPVDDQVVTPGNLRGALSVGQAVDVSCAARYIIGFASTAGMSLDDGTTWINNDQTNRELHYLQEVRYKGNTGSSGAPYIGFDGGAARLFPKYAPGLKYLFIADVKLISGASQSRISWYDNQWHRGETVELSTAEYKRVYAVVESNTVMLYLVGTANTDFDVYIKNWRQYEVTALTDEAIAYIAQLPDPDAFFRTTSVYSLRDKYLVKQDMVCPFIQTISMPDNSDLTVAAGLSYKIRYTNNNPHIITADTIPVDGYGWDTHIQMFIKGTSSIVFQQPLILMDALTPNAGHNLLIKWRDGDAMVYVDDTNAGNIVVAATGTTAGTLNYSLQQDPGSGEDNYIIFAAATDGLTCDAGTVSVAYNTDVLGNGTDATTITGNIGVASGKTINFQSLTIDGGTLGGAGAMNLDDVNINGECIFDHQTAYHNIFPSHVVINEDSEVLCNATRLRTSTIAPATISGVTNSKITFQNDTGYIECNNDVTLSGVTVTGNAPGVNTALFTGVSNYTCSIMNCTLNNNTNNPTVINTKNIVNSIVLKRGDKNINYGTIEVWANNFTCNIVDSYIGFSAYDATTTISGLIAIGSDVVYNIQGSTIYGYFSAFDISRGNCYFNFSGSNTCAYTGRASQKRNSKTFISIADNSIMNISEQLFGDLFLRVDTNKNLLVGDNVTFIGKANKQFSIDACRVSRIEATGKFYNADATDDGDYIVITSMLPIWKATNITFAYILDASAANTIKLTGTTFTSAAKVLNANRIQLPASTTVSFQGNTNAADTKILEAPVIVVGDDAAAPDGSATVVNAAGTTSTVSGIGTYIDKEGDNDFVSLSNVSTVSTSATSGAGSLPEALTGSNKFVRLGDGTVGTVGEATNAVDKTVMTNDYEPIIGGTFSLTSATVDEATKTVAIQSGGTMSIVDIRGGKDSVIDLPDYIDQRVNAVSFASNCSFRLNVGSIQTAAGGASEWNFEGCSFSKTGTGNYVIYARNNGTISIRDCAFPESKTGIFCAGSSSVRINVGGSNVINRIYTAGAGKGDVFISSGAVVDLTGNTNTAPIAPGGGITFEQGGATVLYSSGAVSGSYMMDNVTLPAGAKLTNTAAVDLGGTKLTDNSLVSGAVMSGVTITGGVADYGGALQTGGAWDNREYTFKGCIFSGNSASTNARALFFSPRVGYTGNYILDGCIISGNNGATTAATLLVGNGGKVHINNSIIDNGSNDILCQGSNSGTGQDTEVFLSGTTVVGNIWNRNGAVVRYIGSNTFTGSMFNSNFDPGSVILTSGAILDLTGNTNTAPIAPGGGVIVDGGCQVITSAGSTVSIAGGTYTKINNDGTTE